MQCAKRCSRGDPRSGFNKTTDEILFFPQKSHCCLGLLLFCASFPYIFLINFFNVLFSFSIFIIIAFTCFPVQEEFSLWDYGKMPARAWASKRWPVGWCHKPHFKNSPVLFLICSLCNLSSWVWTCHSTQAHIKTPGCRRTREAAGERCVRHCLSWNLLVDCLDPTCSGRGVCVQGECHCFVGWGGPGCESPRASCMDQCSGHGAFLADTGTCSCDPNWTGHDCSTGESFPQMRINICRILSHSPVLITLPLASICLFILQGGKGVDSNLTNVTRVYRHVS